MEGHDAAASSAAVPEELMSPQWRQIKRLLHKVHLGLEAADQPLGECMGDDQLDYLDIDSDTRKEMLFRQNKLILGHIEEHVKTSQKETALLGNVDSWLVEAATKLEQDEEDEAVGNAFSTGANARPNAVVGQLLNYQTEMGMQLTHVHAKMTAMMEVRVSSPPHRWPDRRTPSCESTHTHTRARALALVDVT